MDIENGSRGTLVPDNLNTLASGSVPNNADTTQAPQGSEPVGSQQQMMAQMYAQLMSQPGLMMMPFMFPGQPFPMFARMPVSTEMEENPTYVNAKQYKRILKRREARARLEERRRIPTSRKTFLHKSRHEHACRRKRGPGGRFLTKSELENEYSDEIAVNGSASDFVQDSSDAFGELVKFENSPTRSR